MKAKCKARVGAAIGRAPTEAETTQIDRNIKRSMRALAKTDPDWRGLDPAERLERAAEHAASRQEAYAEDVAALNEPATDGETLNQLIGPKAKTANKKILKRAKKMDQKGATRDEIWAETAKLGQPWYKDEDGQWISEVEDGSVIVSEGTGKLGDLVEYPALFDAYPKLKKEKTSTQKRGDDTADRGEVSPGNPNSGDSAVTLGSYRPRKHRRLFDKFNLFINCLLYTSPSPRDKRQSRMPSSA